MTKKEFLEKFGDIRKKEIQKKYGISGISEPRKLVEVIQIDYVRNLLRYLNNPHFPREYVIKNGEIWIRKTLEDLERIDKLTENDVKEILKKTRIAKELVKRGFPVTVEFEKIPLGNAEEPIGWKVYALFSASVESLAVFYEPGGLNKFFIFVEDGVFSLKAPPPIRDCTTLHGLFGIFVHEDTLYIQK